MKEKWEDVHLMFYQACRCGGVGETKAKVMYYAVYNFGPRWEPGQEFAKSESGTKTMTHMVRRNMPQPTPEIAKKAKDLIESRNPSLDELKTLTIPH